MADNAYTFDFGAGRSPICAIKVTLKPDGRDRLFSVVREFAQLNKFAVRIARLKPDVDVFYIDLWKLDMAVAGENVLEPSVFELSFYIDPSKGGTRDVAVSLAKQLRQALGLMPGVTAEVEEKPD
ncbi:MAG: hypothetical protein WDN31_12515 [Hyphomicrobium sp.]